MFPSARLPIDQLLTLVEPIKPRLLDRFGSGGSWASRSTCSSSRSTGRRRAAARATVSARATSRKLKPGAKVTVSLKPSVMKAAAHRLAAHHHGWSGYRCCSLPRLHPLVPTRRRRASTLVPWSTTLALVTVPPSTCTERSSRRTRRTASSSTWVSPSRVTRARRCTSSTKILEGRRSAHPVPRSRDREARGLAGGKAEVVLQDGLINDEDVEDGKEGLLLRLRSHLACA